MFRLCWIILTWSFTLTVQIDLGDELLKNMVTTTESPSTSEFQCANGFRIPWLLTCEGTNHCTDGSDEDPAMCLPRTCPMGFPYKCVASGRCLSELWLCDGQKDCPDGADENQIACKLDPVLLLQRIMRKMKNHKDLKDYFDIELSPIPLAFFDKFGLFRRSRKASLYNFYLSVTRSYDVFKENATIVIDGGYLLHNVVWPKKGTYLSVCEAYITHVKQHYGNKITVIFDGYLNSGNSLRCPERRRRQRKKKNECEDLNEIHETMDAVVPSLLFLSNYKNKVRLIEMLSKRFRNAGFEVIQAENDADNIIVNTAVQKARAGQPVIVLGQDVDLIVLLIVFSSLSDDIMLHRPGTGSSKNRSYHIRSLKYQYGYMIPNLLFLHAVSGCDSTSSVFQLGKLKHLEAYHNNRDLQKILLIFNNASASPEDILRVGEYYLLRLYNAPVNISLNMHRFNVFCDTLKSSNEPVDISLLPPTLEAAKQHIFRAYLQVQLWRGNNLNPLDWGWEEDGDMIRPAFTQKPFSKDALLELISIACIKMFDQRAYRTTKGMTFAMICDHCYSLNLKISSIGNKTLDDRENNHTIAIKKLNSTSLN